MTNHTPTPEQELIVDAFQHREDLVIEAGAGTGKTSTLRLISASAPHERGLYIAYNRAIADEAARTFPEHTTCKTAHALAFAAVGRAYAERLRGPRMPARETAAILGITGPTRVNAERVLAPAQLSRLVMETVARFCHSADPAVTARHLPSKPGLDDPESMAALAAAILPLADRAWRDLTQPGGRLRFTHDCYLKIWQLSGPRLPYDFLLLDEAQDANPVIASIVTQQRDQQVVLVGDRSQAIYGWNGAIDAMSGWRGRRLVLSQSFRFGDAIADEANKWLELLEAPLRLSGYHRINSAVAKVGAPAAILCRTNAEAIGQVMDANKAGRPAAMVGGSEQIRRLAEAAVSLKAGLGTDHPELFAFRTWSDLREYVEEDAAGSDLKVFVRLIDAFGPEKVMDTVDRLVDERRAQVVVSTAHRAKGREWDTVRIADDFEEPKVLSDPELMLAYVATTRARHVLDRGPLSWIDDRLMDAQPPLALVAGAAEETEE